MGGGAVHVDKPSSLVTPLRDRVGRCCMTNTTGGGGGGFDKSQRERNRTVRGLLGVQNRKIEGKKENRESEGVEETRESEKMNESKEYKKEC